MIPTLTGPTGGQLLLQLINSIEDLSPVIPAMGELLVGSVLENFDKGGRPNKWKQSERARKEGGQTLVDDKNMMNSTHWDADGDSALVVGLSDEKAVWHDSPSKKSNNPQRKILMIQDEDYDDIGDLLAGHIDRVLR